jgi:hypothetical protein
MVTLTVVVDGLPHGFAVDAAPGVDELETATGVVVGAGTTTWSTPRLEL